MEKSIFAVILTMMLVSLFAASALAVPVTYSVQLNAIDSANNTAKLSQVYNSQCDNICPFSNTLDLPQNTTLINYTISYPNGNYKVYFASNNGLVVQQNDSIVVEIIQAQANTTNQTTPPPVPQISCTNDKCDSSCLKCADNNCHAQPFTCVSELTMDKITPETTKTGIAQLNILLRNTGTVDLTDIYAEVSGDGVTTLDKIAMDKLVVGDKDYAFVKINATKAGKIDLVIKIYIGGQLRSKLIGQLSVFEDKVPVVAANTTKEIEYNVTQLNLQYNELKIKYDSLTKEYQQKRIDGYVVDIIYDKLKSTSQFLTSAQAALFSGDYKIAKTNMEVANESLSDIELQLKDAVKQQTSLADTIRANILYVGAIAAALVSMFSLIAHFRKVVSKEKLERIRDKVKFEKKDKALAKKDKAFTKKDKELAKEIKEIKKVVKIKPKKPAKNNEKKPGKKGDDDLEGGMSV